MASSERYETPEQDRLRYLGAITDSALGHLSADNLFGTLLDRVFEIVEADTATLLLVDGDTGELVARASRGVEEEVRQGVRVPIGAGFAGRVAIDRRPLMIDRVDHTTVANPILWERGIRVMLGVPLLAAGEVVGVLHVGRLQDHPFTAQDAEILSVAGDRMATAIQVEQRREAQAAATLLTRSLHPGPLPRFPGFELSARYLPSEHGGVGGDWYDVFVLPSGELWIIVGDAAGHGLGAAVVMGRAQTMLRAFATLGAEPEEVIEHAGRAHRIFEPAAMVTVLCARSTPPYESVTIATAGHPPPVLAEPSASPVLVDLPVGPPLGINPRTPRTSAEIGFPAGSILLLYTDGLVERRDEPIDEGLDRLREAVTVGHPDTVCRTVIRAMLGPNEPRDDVAMIAIRRAA